MNHKFKRSDRVGELIREEVASMINRRELKDSRIGFVTLTQFDLSKDLKNMKLYISVMGNDTEKQNTLDALEQAKGFIKRQLGHSLYLKRIPELTFKIDSSLDYGDKISKILNQIKKDETTSKD